jgi:hypothetical protein
MYGIGKKEKGENKGSSSPLSKCGLEAKCRLHLTSNRLSL